MKARARKPAAPKVEGPRRLKTYPKWWPARLVRMGIYPLHPSELAKPGAYAAESDRIHAIFREQARRHAEARAARLAEEEARKPRCRGCGARYGKPDQKPEPINYCPTCEGVSKMTARMSPGGAWLMKPRKDRSKSACVPNKLVEVDAKVAKRARYLGETQLIEDKRAPVVSCAIFLDDKTGKLYGQPYRE